MEKESLINMDVCLYFSILGRLHLSLILDELYPSYVCMYLGTLSWKIFVITSEAWSASSNRKLITPELSKVTHV